MRELLYVVDDILCRLHGGSHDMMWLGDQYGRVESISNLSNEFRAVVKVLGDPVGQFAGSNLAKTLGVLLRHIIGHCCYPH
jgi:hypothetical protein